MNDALRRLTIATYASAIFFVLSPIVDVAASSWPFSPGAVQWRYAFAALTANYLVSVLFGLLLAALVAAAAGHLLVLRLVAVAALAWAVGLLVLEAGLVLDVLQVTSLVPSDEQEMFRIGSVKTAVKIALVLVVFVLVAVGAFRGSKRRA